MSAAEVSATVAGATSSSSIVSREKSRSAAEIDLCFGSTDPGSTRMLSDDALLPPNLSRSALKDGYGSEAEGDAADTDPDPEARIAGIGNGAVAPC